MLYGRKLGFRHKFAYVGNNPINYVDPFGKRPLNAGEMQTFSEALAILSSLGGKYKALALELRDYDAGGVIIVDDSGIFTGYDAPTQALTDWRQSDINRRIRLNPNNSFLEQDTCPRRDRHSSNMRRARFMNALILASILIHELWHYDNRSASEQFTYSLEVDFLLAYQAKVQADQAQQDAIGIGKYRSYDRVDAVTQIGRERESAGFEKEVLKGPRRFPLPKL